MSIYMQELKLNPLNTGSFTRPGIILILLTTLFLVQACGSPSQQSPDSGIDNTGNKISINSHPAGVTVLANGKKVGTTPFKLDLSSVFSPEWVKGENYGIDYRIKGSLNFKKSGCDDFTIPVRDTNISTNIDVTLTCKQALQNSKAADAKPAIAQDIIEQRLIKLEKLFKDGSISAEEYKQHRNRILGEL